MRHEEEPVADRTMPLVVVICRRLSQKKRLALVRERFEETSPEDW